MINEPGMAPAPLDTTGLENSFENLGRTMVDVLTLQPCKISKRNIHHEMMGRSSAAVKKIIRSIDPNLRWSLAHQ